MRGRPSLPAIIQQAKQKTDDEKKSSSKQKHEEERMARDKVKGEHKSKKS